LLFLLSASAVLARKHR